jgi:HSP20 family protein
MNTQFKTTQLPNLLNDFINVGFAKVFNDDFGIPNVLQQTPVNITETNEAYEIEMVAPGREKSEFAISLDKNLLTISYEKKVIEKETTDKDEFANKFILKEFSIKNFKRTFTINEKGDATKITASYNNGILHVIVPKKEIVIVVPTTITVQ